MNKYRIIIVENDEDEQEFMKDAFNKSDLFDLLVLVKNGNELLNWLQQNQEILPHLVLTDLNMPGKNGYDIINEFKNNAVYKNIPVIITSTSGTQSIIDKCLTMGAADFIVKPDTFIDYNPFVISLFQKINSLQLN
jgi:CheY-like chemotaxis protein